MNSPFLWLLSPGRQKKLRINLYSYKIPTWNQILPLTEMLQIQNVWDTLSVRKQFLEAELNVREFLGIQGIIHPISKCQPIYYMIKLHSTLQC